jgi:hypothetical protein
VERWIKRRLDGSDSSVPLHLSEVFWSVGLESDGRERRRRWISPARVSGFTGVEVCGSGVDSGELLVTPRRWRGHDGVQEVDTISRAWSSSSFSSRRGGGSRLEIGGAAGCFGRAPAHRSNAPKIKRGRHEVHQKERREIGGRRGSPATPDLREYARWFWELR